MHRNQHQHRNLEVFTVKPGPETGLYYILVANLAHRTTWRELKSFASQACEVDHAEVYPPTSGFVRRRPILTQTGYLDGNTLEYRALQADGRNLNQDTVVKLLLTDYHAVKIMRGDNTRVVAEPGDPPTEPLEVLSQGLGGMTLAGGAYLDYQGNPSPGLSLGDLQWRYPTGPPYGGRGYQPAPAPALRPPGPLAYPAMAVPNQGFVPQPVLGPPPAVYQGGANNSSASTSPQTAIVPYPYGESPTYYPQGAVYDGRAPSYTGFIPPPPPPQPGKNSGPYTNPAYDYSSDALTPIQPDNVPSIIDSRAAGVFEPRKILIRDLEREGLSEPAVTALLIQHTGIGNAPGQIERVEIPLNREGRSRGTAYVTFGSADLASTAAAGVNGLRVGSREVSARVVENGGGSREGLAEGGRSASGRRVGGASSGKTNRGGGGGGNSKSHSGKVSRSGQPAQAMGSVIVSSDASLKSPVVNDPLSDEPVYTTTAAANTSMSASGSMSSLVEGSSQSRKKEDRPVIVDGSGGRWKKESAPVVVDGSGGAGSQSGSGSGNKKAAGGGNRGARF
ncbi:uncharacterized protein C8A04DRAFT_15991 [Dichotomopilus funicola]|uniref:RRM domain-containing protein n=1 Tax=Dichotomopilus funicola TaxID=1934379 RepID=A0AAN6UWS9_9PEZI|nr:hypothetical protein C8A04DRAFT_15991 [Dichotomopilus funicola]